MLVYQHIALAKRTGRKLLALLLDPDQLMDEQALKKAIGIAEATGVDLIFFGGSLLSGHQFEAPLQKIKSMTDLPVVLFPGSALQVSAAADAILFTTLISGRNPEFLIGQQVLAAPAIKASGIEVIPTGYMLIDSGKPTTASYVSNTWPIPYNKPEIAATTALAGEMLGLKLMYLDSGSGADHAVSTAMISAVNNHISVPLVVGGGINSAEALISRFRAGADVAVVGTAAEKDPFILRDMAVAIKESF